MNDKTDDPVARIMAHVSAGPDRVHERSEVQYWNSLSPASQGIWHCRARAARIAVIKEMIEEGLSNELLVIVGSIEGFSDDCEDADRHHREWFAVALTVKLKELEG